MKIKGLLLGMMTCAALAACSNEDIVENNTGTLEGDAYVALNIALAGDASRAASEGDVEDGTKAENAIKDAAFLFYNGETLLQTVTGAELKGLNGGGALDFTKAVIVLKNPGVIPTSVVAVLNPSSTSFPSTLTGLKDKSDYVMTGQAEGDFVMTNSTYVKADGSVQMETPISAANVFSKPEDAKGAPVTIYVERALTKVTADFSKLTVELPSETVDGGEVTLTAKVLGWNLSGTNKSAYALKHIDNTWTGTWWKGTNRTFWAQDPNYVATSTTTNDLNFYEFPTTSPTEAYCLENTVDNYAENNYKAATHLLVGAEILVNGESTTLYGYLGQKYTESGVLALMSNNANINKYYTKSGSTATSFSPSYIDLTTKSSTSSYKVTPALTTAAKAMTFYTKKADGSLNDTPVAIAEVENAVKALGDVDKYADGKAYYYVPIEHFGTGFGTVGLVRNHVYNLAVTKIKGFGTPVPNPDDIIIPEKPSKDDYYIAAKVEVLKWKIVNQGNIELE